MATANPNRATTRIATVRTVLLTFDNLGEASELERGSWPAGAPLGRHPSVTRALPRLLDELDRHRLTATFFVEGLNGELYPEPLRQIMARGHELGVHGWRHEPWAQLAPARERELLTRATDALRRIGATPRGFRPPGGDFTAQTPGLLRELGYGFWSPSAPGTAAPAPGTAAPASATAPPAPGTDAPGLATLAFEWELVDAFHLMERFADLRARRGAPAQARTASACGDWFAEWLARDDAGGVEVVIMHPFLMLEDAWWRQVRRLLGQLAELRDAGRATVVVAGSLRTADAPAGGPTRARGPANTAGDPRTRAGDPANTAGDP